MSRLSDLYRAMETLRREGLSWSDEQERQLSNLEENIIRDEILPALSQQVAPVLSQIERKLTLVIDYEPGQEASVRMTRKSVVINDSDSKVFRLVPYDKREPQRQVTVNKKPDPASQLTVTFRDGTRICEFHSNRTFAAAIEKIGIERVLRGRFKLQGTTIVTEQNPNKPGVLQSGKYFIFTSASNKEKIKALKKISEVLNLGLTFDTNLKPVKTGEASAVEPRNAATTAVRPAHRTGTFGDYLDGLKVRFNTISSYKRSITDSVVLNALEQVSGKRVLLQVTDPTLIERVMGIVGTDWKNGYPHAMLRHYCIYLRQCGQMGGEHEIPFEAIQARTRSIPNRKLKVVFGDGTVIDEANAAATFQKAIRKIGPERVRRLGMRQVGIPLVDNRKAERYEYARAQKEVGGGLYVMTLSDTLTKQAQLEQIARQLGIKLNVIVS